MAFFKLFHDPVSFLRTFSTTPQRKAKNSWKDHGQLQYLWNNIPFWYTDTHAHTVNRDLDASMLNKNLKLEACLNATALPNISSCRFSPCIHNAGKPSVLVVGTEFVCNSNSGVKVVQLTAASYQYLETLKLSWGAATIATPKVLISSGPHFTGKVITSSFGLAEDEDLGAVHDLQGWAAPSFFFFYFLGYFKNLKNMFLIFLNTVSIWRKGISKNEGQQDLLPNGCGVVSLMLCIGRTTWLWRFESFQVRHWAFSSNLRSLDRFSLSWRLRTSHDEKHEKHHQALSARNQVFLSMAYPSHRSTRQIGEILQDFTGSKCSNKRWFTNRSASLASCFLSSLFSWKVFVPNPFDMHFEILDSLGMIALPVLFFNDLTCSEALFQIIHPTFCLNVFNTRHLKLFFLTFKNIFLFCFELCIHFPHGIWMHLDAFGPSPGWLPHTAWCCGPFAAAARPRWCAPGPGFWRRKCIEKHQQKRQVQWSLLNLSMHIQTILAYRRIWNNMIQNDYILYNTIDWVLRNKIIYTILINKLAGLQTTVEWFIWWQTCDPPCKDLVQASAPDSLHRCNKTTTYWHWFCMPHW